MQERLEAVLTTIPHAVGRQKAEEATALSVKVLGPQGLPPTLPTDRRSWFCHPQHFRPRGLVVP